VSKEKYGLARNVEAKTKPPQIYSSAVLIPAAWPRELKRENVETVFSFTVLPDGSTKDVRRLSALHTDLERVGTVYLGRLRYSPAESEGSAVPTQAEVTLRFSTDGFFPEQGFGRGRRTAEFGVRTLVRSERVRSDFGRP